MEEDNGLCDLVDFGPFTKWVPVPESLIAYLQYLADRRRLFGRATSFRVLFDRLGKKIFQQRGARHGDYVYRTRMTRRNLVLRPDPIAETTSPESPDGFLRRIRAT